MRIVSMILLINIVIILLPFCKKPGPYTVDVSAITATDAQGNIIGSIDNTDWTKDPAWHEEEKLLFVSDPPDLIDTEVATIAWNPAYPNPVQSGSLTIVFNTSAITFIKLVITDNVLKKLFSYSYKTQPGINALNISLNGSTFKVGSNYRIYYAFYSAGNPMYYFGHGDVSIKN